MGAILLIRRVTINSAVVVAEQMGVTSDTWKYYIDGDTTGMVRCCSCGWSWP
jgi:hypothetical protein